MVLIDTSAWLFALRKDFHPAVKGRIESLLKGDDVAINGMIKLELLGGTRLEQEFNRLKNRLDALTCIESTESLWGLSAKLAFDLRRKGITIPFSDIFIAASAVERDTLLVHADRHFELCREQIGLKTENLLPLLK